MSKNRNIRSLTVDGVEYTWRVGKLNVLVRGPDNFKLVLGLCQATGGYYAERDFEKGNASIMPSHIRDRIRENLASTAW